MFESIILYMPFTFNENTTDHPGALQVPDKLLSPVTPLWGQCLMQSVGMSCWHGCISVSFDASCLMSSAHTESGKLRVPHKPSQVCETLGTWL
jgi:hypothetical protein